MAWTGVTRVLEISLCGLLMCCGFHTVPLLGTLEYLPSLEGHSIEFVYQSPPRVKGILFLAHGCNHNARDFWPKSDMCSSCLGLPEERKIVSASLAHNYFVVAISSAGTCWGTTVDTERVKAVISKIRQIRNMLHIPLYAIGASSGGAFVARLPLHIPVAAVAVQIMFIPASSLLKGPSATTYPPSLWICMERDHRTLEGVKKTVRTLTARGRRAEVVVATALPITPTFFALRIPTLGGKEQQGEHTSQTALEISRRMYMVLQQGDALDGEGYLRQDPRVTTWRELLGDLRPSLLGDSLVADVSAISEEMNVAYAMHEITADFMTETINFFESSSPPGLDSLR